MMKLNHLFIPYLALLAFIFGGILISGGLDWYATLVLPPWHVSNRIISLIWAIIYIAAAWSLLIVWNAPVRDAKVRTIVLGFGICTFLNLVWSIVFFYLHSFVGSIIIALMLGISVVALATLTYPRSKKAALLLTPYIAWVFFAAYLNYVVFMLNN
jgi:translocator protein